MKKIINKAASKILNCYSTLKLNTNSLYLVPHFFIMLFLEFNEKINALQENANYLFQQKVNANTFSHNLVSKCYFSTVNKRES